MHRNASNPDSPGYLWVFLDMSQKDHRLYSGVPSVQQAIHILCEVVRNPKQVFDAVKKTRMQLRGHARELYEMSQPLYETEVFPKTRIIHGVEGHFEQRIVRPLSPQNVAKEIMKIVRKHRDANCEVHNMVVLASRLDDVDIYFPHLNCLAQSEGIQVVTDPIAQEEGCLVIDSVRRFRGLERAVVIAVDLNVGDTNFHSLNRLYIQAISRSIMNIYLIESKEVDCLPF